MNIIYTLKYWDWEKQKPIDIKNNLIFKNYVLVTQLQFIFVEIQLMIIVGLCLDGGKSYWGGFFKTSIVQV